MDLYIRTNRMLGISIIMNLGISPHNTAITKSLDFLAGLSDLGSNYD